MIELVPCPKCGGREKAHKTLLARIDSMEPESAAWTTYRPRYCYLCWASLAIPASMAIEYRLHYPPGSEMVVSGEEYAALKPLCNRLRAEYGLPYDP